jgi:hypothetical protein
MTSLAHPKDEPPEALVRAWHEEEAESRRLAAEAEYIETRRPAINLAPTTYLTRARMATEIGVSARTFDKLLTDAAFVQATGAWKSSNGRMAHWRFPVNAPDSARAFLNGRRK